MVTSRVVEVNPETLSATHGERVQIICTTESHETLGVEWEFLRNGSDHSKTICSGRIVYSKADEKYECKNETNIHTFTINSVSFNDTGLYTCTEKEGYGPAHNSSRLTVYCEYHPRLHRQHLSYDDCLEDKRGDYQNCSVLYCVTQLCTNIYTLI